MSRVPAQLKGPVPEELRDKARRALESGGAVEFTIQAFGGFVRKPIQFDSAALDAIARTSPGRPLLGRMHDGGLFQTVAPEREGVIEEARVTAGGAIEQDLSVSGKVALQDLADGVIPQYSIQWQRTENTTVSCSACGALWSSGESCDCPWPGRFINRKNAAGEMTRERVEVVFGGDAEHAETTRLYTPAADLTGITAFQLDGKHSLEDDERALRELKSSLIEVKQIDGGLSMADKSEEQKPTAGDDAPEVDVEQLRRENEDLKLTLQTEREQNEQRLQDLEKAMADEVEARKLEQAKEVVLAAARDGKIGPAPPVKLDDGSTQVDTTWLQDEVDACAKDVDGYKQRLARIRGNPAFAAGQVSRAPGAPPTTGEEPVTQNALKTEAKLAAEANGDTPRANLIQLTLQAQKAGRLVI